MVNGYNLSLSFHDGSLNLYWPTTTGYYDGSAITGLNSPKVKFHKCPVSTSPNHTPRWLVLFYYRGVHKASAKKLYCFAHQG